MSKSPSNDPLSVFCSYSHRDEALRRELDLHLAGLQRSGVISHWFDRKINPGVEWKNSIDTHLEFAHVVLLLISADFLASDYCYDVELARALERHSTDATRVIPIILRPCDWTEAAFARFQALPTEAKPVTSWPDQDAAWLDVVTGIRAACVDIQRNRQASVQIYCESPVSDRGVLVWPSCKISVAKDRTSFGASAIDLKWGESKTVSVEPNVEYSIVASTMVPMSGPVAITEALFRARKNQMIQLVYRVNDLGSFRYEGELVKVVHL
jgi:hypothetical protein